MNEKLPAELQAQLSKLKNTSIEAMVLDVLTDREVALSCDAILISVYNKYGRIVNRKSLSAILSSLKKKMLITKVLDKKFCINKGDV